MGIFTRFTIKSLAKNRARTAVSVLGIALSCALITAIFTSAATMADGLYRRTLADEGSWQVQIDNLSPDGIAAARSDDLVDAVAIVEHYGAAALPADVSSDLGPLLEIDSYPASPDGVVVPPTVTEGAPPTSSTEILLPSYLKGATLSGGEAVIARDDQRTPAPGMSSDEPLAVGSVIEIAAGRRAPLPGGDANGLEIAPNSALRYDDAMEPLEYLAGIQEARSFTVVGFYDNWEWATSIGCVAFIGPGSAVPPIATTAYLATSITDYQQMSSFGSDLVAGTPGAIASGYSDAAVTLHNSLLRYQGMTDGRGIWTTLAQIAGVLSAVVIVASVSLIYNAFAISVAERTRQFGLLSSLGASRRQLRRTVLVEGALLAVVALPLGILMGLAGTWVVFQLTGEGLALLFDNAMGAGIVISPAVIAIAAGLSLVTIAVSAAIPALRASRVSAVDAIRQTQDIAPTRRERARQRRAARARRRAGHQAPFRPALLDRMRLRIGGVPELLAHRTLSRSRGKGRVAVASLAVSVALLVISGAFGTYMEALSGVVADSGTADLMLTAGTVRPEGGDAADYVALLDDTAAALSSSDGAQPVGFSTIVNAYAELPAQMLADGNIHPMMDIRFIDDASWTAYLRQLGIDEAAYTDPAHPRAIGYNRQLDRSGGVYTYRSVFAQTGTVRLFTQFAPRAGETFYGLSGSGDEPSASYFATGEGAGDAPDSQVPLDEAVAATYDLAVGALAEEAPACDPDPSGSGAPVLYLPLSSLPAIAASVDESLIQPADYAVAHPFSITGYNGSRDQVVTFYFNADDPAACAAALEETIETRLADNASLSFASVYNLDEAFQQNRLINMTIQAFTTCFAVICGLIAVANVFNTLSTSIILRKSEFAVLKSIGMGNQAFRRMIVRECASYAVRGLGIGLALAALVSMFLYWSMDVSFRGIGFAMPPAWVAAAVTAVLAVLIASVAYALRRCRAASVVDALREDAI